MKKKDRNITATVAIFQKLLKNSGANQSGKYDYYEGIQDEELMKPLQFFLKIMGQQLIANSVMGKKPN